jgi:hypothetical protein
MCLLTTRARHILLSRANGAQYGNTTFLDPRRSIAPKAVSAESVVTDVESTDDVLRVLIHTYPAFECFLHMLLQVLTLKSQESIFFGKFGLKTLGISHVLIFVFPGCRE